jgi:uncharacterized repeat protein (TIGR02543 family)
MPPASRSLPFFFRRIGVAFFAATLSLATSFAGHRQLNEAPPNPEPALSKKSSANALSLNAVPNGFVVDPSSRETSRIFFRTVYAASENVPSGWNGSVATGNAGTTSAAFKEAVQRRVNYFRAMSGVPAGITFDSTYNAKDQQAALMMSANNSLNHAPPPSWTYYTADGAEAAGHSDLFLGSYGPDAITGYIEDFGSPNAEVGHRRWILYPQTKMMGTGDLPPDGAFDSANALWVATPEFGTARPTVRDEFVAWPPPGYVPYSLVYPRWSFSYPGATFTSATVAMKRNGVSVPVTIQNRGPGAGEETLVWAWNNLNANVEATPTPPPASDTPVQVTINGVVIGGQTRNFTYTVTLYDPAKAGADTVVASVTGPLQPVAGASQIYSCNTIPNASGYQFRNAPISALTATEGAENGTANVTTDAPTATIISTAYHASGAKSFHFTTPDFGHQAIVLNRTVLASSTTQLKFKSRFGYATPDQIAHAQVSTDEGSSWDTLFSAPGTGTPATGFSDQTVSLAAYANRTIRVRFLFGFEGDGVSFNDTEENFGWYLDDISFTNAREISGATLSPVTAGATSSFTPSAAGSYALQARGQFFGDYLFEWGPVLEVTALPSGAPQIGTPPANRTANVGDTVQLSVVATGPGTLSYQWFHGSQPIADAIAATLTLFDLTPDDAGDYHVEVTNSYGTTPSASAKLTVVIPAPVVTTLTGATLSESAVQLSGHVEVNGQTVACGFEYGTTTGLASTIDAGTAAAAKDFSATISSLGANTTIYYRAYADVTGGGRVRGAVKTITTLKAIALLNVSIEPAGSGTVAGLPTGDVRVGDTVTLTAQAASGFSFTGWTGGLTKTTATLKLTMPASLSLVANFSSSPILNAAGKYRGLILTTPVTHDSCGLLTLTIAAKGAFTGQATVGGTNFALKGVFDASGVAHFGAVTEAALPRRGKTPLLLRLNLPEGNSTPLHVLGDVREAGGLTATVDAARAVFTAAKTFLPPLQNPPPAWIGAYTADLTVNPLTPVNGLAGRGWLAGTVGKDGIARFAGVLADGTRWSATQPLALAGTVPIYAALYGRKGSFFGEVQLAGSPVTLAASASWFRPAIAGPRFAAGWPAGVTLTLAGGAWTPFRPAISWPLPALGTHSGAAHLWANGGAFPPTLDWAATVNLATGKAVITPSPAGATAAFVPKAANGTFTGRFKESAKSPSISFSGVLVSGADRARGFFLTPTGSGAVTLLPQ